MFPCKIIFVLVFFSIDIFGQGVRERKPTINLKQGDVVGVKMNKKIYRSIVLKYR